MARDGWSLLGPRRGTAAGRGGPPGRSTRSLNRQRATCTSSISWTGGWPRRAPPAPGGFSCASRPRAPWSKRPAGHGIRRGDRGDALRVRAARGTDGRAPPPARRRERRHESGALPALHRNRPARGALALTGARARRVARRRGAAGPARPRLGHSQGDQSGDTPAALVRLAEDERTSRAGPAHGRPSPERARSSGAGAPRRDFPATPSFCSFHHTRRARWVAATEAGFTALDRFVLLVRPIRSARPALAGRRARRRRHRNRR